MADSKISALPLLANTAGEDLLVIIDNPAGTSVSKKISINYFFGYVPSNTYIDATFGVAANTNFYGDVNYFDGDIDLSGDLLIAPISAPEANTSTDIFAQYKIALDENYLYYRPDTGEVKRTPLYTFNETFNANNYVTAATLSGYNYAPRSDLSWQLINSNTTLVSSRKYLCDTSSAAFTVTLPSSPQEGTEIIVKDHKDTFGTHNLTIARNGSTINNLSENLVADVSGYELHLMYRNATWRFWGIN